MARPGKAAAVIEDEGRSHRTRGELEQRKTAEKAALTGLPMRENPEVRGDPVAHREFLRVKKLLTAVGKNDALYEAVMNDYCRFKSDIARYTAMREAIQADLAVLDCATLDPEARYKLKASLVKQIMDCDRLIQTAQKKRFDIEKENAMTISSAQRSIPKTVSEKKNPLLEAIEGDDV